MKYCLLSAFLILFNAFAEDSYVEVRNVEVKQSGQNSLEAKKKALSESIKSAFEQLISFEEFARYTAVMRGFSREQVQNCVYDYSIENEKFSDSFYIAEFSYRFSRNKITEMLRANGERCDDIPKASSVKIALCKDDYLNNFHEINQQKHRVDRFSSDRVVLEVADVRRFQNLQINFVQLSE